MFLAVPAVYSGNAMPLNSPHDSKINVIMTEETIKGGDDQEMK